MILILLAFLYNGKSVGELKEKIIKEKVNKILNQKNNKKTKKFHPKIIHTEKFHIDIKRDKDKELAKKLKEIKISRNEKIRERKNPKPIKIKKELSDLNKRKLKEISKPKIFDNNFFIQKTEKPNIIRQKNSPSLEKEEKIIQEKAIKKNQFTQDFFKKKDERIIDKIRENKSRNSPTLEKKSRTFEKISERKRNDDLTSYIEKFRSKLSWDSPKDYLLSEQIKIQKLKEEKELAKIRAKEEELKAKEAKEFIKKQAELEKQLKLEKEAFEKEKKEQEKQKAKEILDDYLSKKSRKRKGFFAEKQVLRDLKNREQKN